MINPGTIELCRESLESDVKRIEEWLKKNPLTVSESDKEFEKGDEFNARAVKKQNHKASTALLNDCRAALKKMEDESYGICVVCGSEIDEDRLIARPEASRCSKPC